VQRLLAGIDGCSGGWAAALADDNFTSFALRQITSVEELFVDAQAPSILAVDMPIGLPARAGPKGRTPERLVRSFLEGRQSSVFSIPSRSAVYAGVDPNEPDERKRYLRARSKTFSRATDKRALRRGLARSFVRHAFKSPKQTCLQKPDDPYRCGDSARTTGGSVGHCVVIPRIILASRRDTASVGSLTMRQQ
jgi:Protein of unknown function (DUF429)